MRLFPRHRWTGVDHTLDDAAKLCAPHAILTTIVPVWLLCIKEKRSPSPRDFQEILQDQRGFADHDDGDDLLLSSMVGELPHEEHAEQEGDGGDDNQFQFRPGDKKDFAKLNARMRGKARAFAASAPLARLIVARVVLKPVLDLMYDALDLVSSRWADRVAFSVSFGGVPPVPHHRAPDHRR